MAKEYIPREAAMPDGFCVGVSCQECPFCDNPIKGGCKVARFIDAIPAADVVEVVRCRECIFWDTSWNPGVGVIGEAQYCPRCQLVTLKDSFCSGACRKEGGQGDV